MSGQGNRPEDMMKMLAEFRLPGLPDVEQLTNAPRRNFEALSAANKVALEGAQAVARRHMEIPQQSMSEMPQALQSMAGAQDPQARAPKQAKMLKAAYERAGGNMREVADLIQKSNAEPLSLLNHRSREAVEELKKMAPKKG